MAEMTKAEMREYIEELESKLNAISDVLDDGQDNEGDESDDDDSDEDDSDDENSEEDDSDEA